MELIYSAHPFDGKQENIDKVQSIILVIGSALIAGSLYDEKGL